MSIEFNFTCVTALNKEQVDNLISQLRSKPDWAILSQQALEFRLKFLLSPLSDSTWPEDFSLSFEQKRIYVAFHTGTAQQRKLFLEYVSHLLDIGNVQFALEEM